MAGGPFAPTVGVVFDVDPDLGACVGAKERSAARARCRGELVRVGRGRWTPPAATDGRNDIVGLVIVEGLLCREVALADRFMPELLGPQDVLQLPVAVGRPRLSEAISLTAISETTLLVLGESFVGAAARWPCLLSTLLRRLEVQRERLAVQGVIAHLPRAEDRLLLTLWHLAERWGFRTEQGTVLGLALTHDILGQLTGGSRPTATVAVSVLQAEGLVTRLEDGAWLLTAAAEARVDAIAAARSPLRVLGETLSLRQLRRETVSDSRALRAQAAQMRARKQVVGGRRRSG